ncbi:MAG TPA: sigma-70 family RNA polymerase sigma factor, partial [Solirubrobacteraceae bacterium]|nr:sigma-70 family RNA polymerase sigma factor [Solirubrobacteraceae bacterium]
MADRNRRVRGELRAGSRAWLRLATDDRLVAFVRRGDARAFEILYDRHSRELLAFCRYMLGSQQDAEDAVQSTFASAYRALQADERSVALRPWLFAIARNHCLSILRRPRPTGELDGATAPGEDPSARAEQREEVRHMLASLRELPERQRAALLLSGLHGFGHAEIAALLGVRTDQVKSYVYQARSSLISDRQAHGADCGTIREELATARGAALLKGHLRRHLRVCPGCREYAEELSRKRHQLGSLLPVAPSMTLKRRALEAALGKGPAPGTCLGGATARSSVAGATVELAGGGVKALVAKLLAGMACLGAGTGVGTIVVGAAAVRPGRAAPTSGQLTLAHLRLAAAVRPAGASGPADSHSDQAASQLADGGSTGDQPSRLSPVVTRQRSPASQNDSGRAAGAGKSNPGVGNAGAPVKGNGGNPGKGSAGKGNAGNPPGNGNGGNPGKGNAGQPGKGGSGNHGKGNSGNHPGNGNAGIAGKGNPSKGNPGPQGAASHGASGEGNGN